MVNAKRDAKIVEKYTRGTIEHLRDGSRYNFLYNETRFGNFTRVVFLRTVENLFYLFFFSSTISRRF